MLSTPSLTEMPPDFKGYFGRAVNVIITGHFYTISVELSVFVGANTTSEQTFTVVGLKTSDLVVINKPSHTSGLIIGNCRVSADDTLAITFGNLTGSDIDPFASEDYTIVAIRREKE